MCCYYICYLLYSISLSPVSSFTFIVFYILLYFEDHWLFSINSFTYSFTSYVLFLAIHKLFFFFKLRVRFFFITRFQRYSLWFESIINLEISSYFCNRLQCRMCEEDCSVNCFGLTNCFTNVIWYDLCIWWDWNTNKSGFQQPAFDQNHANSGRSSKFLEGRLFFIEFSGNLFGSK